MGIHFHFHHLQELEGDALLVKKFLLAQVVDLVALPFQSQSAIYATFVAHIHQEFSIDLLFHLLFSFTQSIIPDSVSLLCNMYYLVMR